jgi:hypothetical protein
MSLVLDIIAEHATRLAKSRRDGCERVAELGEQDGTPKGRGSDKGSRPSSWRGHAGRSHVRC